MKVILIGQNSPRKDEIKCKQPYLSPVLFEAMGRKERQSWKVEGCEAEVSHTSFLFGLGLTGETRR